MKTITKITVASLLTILGLAATTQTAQAGSYQHLDRLALRLQDQTNDLRREFITHYRHTSAFRHLNSDANKVLALAAHLHETAHHRSSLRHLESDLIKLDRELHHLESLLERIENGHFGHIHDITEHVWELMEDTISLLHHMEEDVEEMQDYRSHYSHYGHRGHGSRHVVIRSGHGGRHGGGIHIGGNGFSFNFGF